MNTGEESKPSISNPHKSRLATELLWWLGGLVLLVVVSFLLLMWSARPKPPIQVALADGRILQIEGVTYGTKHRIGQPAVFLDRFRPWLPRKMKQVLDPKHPQSNFTLDRPGLVVWVNALDPETGTNVDCQGIRTEFVDQYGEVFGEQTSSWFGGQSFWRVGHIFYAYPREERQLNFQVTPWRTNRANNVKLPNPNFCRPAKWSGGPLPQSEEGGCP